MQLARYARAQTELMQTPPVTPENHVNPAAVDARHRPRRLLRAAA